MARTKRSFNFLVPAVLMGLLLCFLAPVRAISGPAETLQWILNEGAAGTDADGDGLLIHNFIYHGIDLDRKGYLSKAADKPEDPCKEILEENGLDPNDVVWQAQNPGGQLVPINAQQACSVCMVGNGKPEWVCTPYDPGGGGTGGGGGTDGGGDGGTGGGGGTDGGGDGGTGGGGGDGTCGDLEDALTGCGGTGGGGDFGAALRLNLKQKPRDPARSHVSLSCGAGFLAESVNYSAAATLVIPWGE